MVAVAQLAERRVCGREGRGFKTRRSPQQERGPCRGPSLLRFTVETLIRVAVAPVMALNWGFSLTFNWRASLVRERPSAAAFSL